MKITDPQDGLQPCQRRTKKLKSVTVIRNFDFKCVVLIE